MRISIYITLLIPLLTLGCNYSTKEASNNNDTNTHIYTPPDAKKNDTLIAIQAPEIPADYITKKLDDYGIKASVKVPKNAKIYKSIINDNEGEREYLLVHLVESSNKKLEIISTRYDLNTLIKNFELSSALYYKTKRVQVDSNTVFFDSEYKGETQEFNKHVYNFLVRVRVGEKFYFITTDSFQEFTSEEYAYKKEDVLKLYSIAKSLTKIQ